MQVKYYSQSYPYQVNQRGEVTTIRFASPYPQMGGQEIREARVQHTPSDKMNKYHIHLKHTGNCLLYPTSDGLPRMKSILARIMSQTGCPLDLPIGWSEQGMQRGGVAHMVTGAW